MSWIIVQCRTAAGAAWRQPFRGVSSSTPLIASLMGMGSGDMASLISSAGISIWLEDDSVHLTNAAYGDIAASLVKLVTKTTTDPEADHLCRPRLELVVTRPREATVANNTPGWILGETQQGGRGRGAPGRGFGGLRGRQAPCHGGATRWVPY